MCYNLLSAYGVRFEWPLISIWLMIAVNAIFSLCVFTAFHSLISQVLFWTYLVFLVVMHPVMITHCLYDQPLGFALSSSRMVPWVYSPMYSYFMTTVVPVVVISTLRVILLLIVLFCCVFNALWRCLSLSWLSNSLLSFSIRHLIAPLNNNMAWSGSLSSTGMDLICKRVRLTSAFVSKHFCCTLYKFYACFLLVIVLGMVR